MTAITRNLPAFIKEPAVGLIGTRCYISLVENLHVSDTVCLKLAISKALGIAIVLGGTVMKVPQLLLILRAKHARGLSLPAFALETLAYLITLVYAYRNSYPFSTYGENLFLTIQNVAITLLIIHYFPTAQGGLTTKRARSNTPVVAMAAFIALVAALVLLRVPMSLMRLLQLATVPISLFSKVPQITENYRNQSTGQLSVFAVTSQVFGCLARVFTTMTEMEDSLVLAGFVLALILNTVLAFQIYTYWGQTVPVSSKEDMRRSEKQSLPSVPHQPAEFPAHQQPAFIHANTPVQSSGGRRWARKVD